MVLMFSGCTQTEKAPAVTSTTLSAQGGLDAKEIAALNQALDDEYKARATYRKVLEKFGDVRPFSNIVGAEENHISELKVLFDNYGLSVPADEWPSKAPSFDTLEEACNGAAQAEIDNAALYDRLLADVSHDDVKSTFEELRDASRNNHLPAFQRCAERR